MKAAAQRRHNATIERHLSGHGLRLTAQRRQVYSVLVRQLDHPTAQEVFLRVKRRMPDISLATVYNCLDALVACGLLRRVRVDSEASRFCPNMQDHGHFYCERCGGVMDVELDDQNALSLALLPPGYHALHYDLAVRGLCRECSASEKVNG